MLVACSSGNLLHHGTQLTLSCCSATADPGPLQRAEWIKFLAPFFNKEVEANKVFDNIKLAYDKANLTGSAEASGAKVAWINTVYMSNNSYSLKFPPYQLRFIKVRNGMSRCTADVTAASAPAAAGLFACWLLCRYQS